MTDERMPRPGDPRSDAGEARPAAYGPAESARPPAQPTEPSAQPPEPSAPRPEPSAPSAPERSDDSAPTAPQGVEREFDVPYDTGALHGLPTGQLLAVGRPAPEPFEAEYEEEEEQRRVYSQVAAVIGTLGAAASLFVGWMLPLSVAAIVFGVLGLRREEHGRVLAFIGIGTGVAGLVFSGVWIGYYAIVFGALSTR